MLIDRPSPLPPLRRARDSSARQNRLNTSAASPGPQPDAVVAHHARRPRRSSPASVMSTGRPSPWSTAFATRLRRIRSTRRGSTSAYTPVGQVQPQRRPALLGEPAHGLDRPGDHAVHVDPLGGQVRDPRVQPADLQQVGEQRLEPVQLGDQQLRAAPQRGQQLVLRGVQHVRGHPHGGQRGAQLVADVRGEPPLQRAELLELADLGLDAAGHLVVRLGQPRHLVVAVHRHPLVEVAVGEPLGDLGGLPHRPHHLPGDEARDAGQQQEQHQPADDQRALHQRERALLGVEREQQVELQVAARGAHRLADDQVGISTPWPETVT